MGDWRCEQGHPMVKGNIRWRRYKDTGKTRAYCIECWKERQANAEASE